MAGDSVTSQGDKTTASFDPGGVRYPLLPFVSIWRRAEVMVILAVVALIFATAATYVEHHRFESGFVVLGVVLLIFVPLLRLGTRRHYVAVEADGLRIYGLRRSSLVPFEAIRQVRVQPLQMIFDVPSRRDRLDRSLRSFRQTSACLTRLSLDQAAVTQLGQLLGRGTAIDQDLILIVAQARELERSLLERVRRRPPLPGRHR
jgi:hypothetical protein